MAEFLKSKNLEGLEGIQHGFFTRQGGVSEGLYASLNCGFGSDDETECVAQNRQRVCAELGCETSEINTPYQTHSADVVVADEGWSRQEAPNADAIVTRKAGLVIGILTADCAPVLFADEKAGIIGAAHAGWRGAIGGILEATIEAMIAQGARRSDIRAAVGPCLHQDNYEIGSEFEEQFIKTHSDYKQYFKVVEKSGRSHFDLPGFVLARLEGAGLEKTAYSALCTYENESQFFSYRRNCHKKLPDYGRQVSAIVLT